MITDLQEFVKFWTHVTVCVHAHINAEITKPYPPFRHVFHRSPVIFERRIRRTPVSPAAEIFTQSSDSPLSEVAIGVRRRTPL